MSSGQTVLCSSNISLPHSPASTNRVEPGRQSLGLFRFVEDVVVVVVAGLQRAQATIALKAIAADKCVSIELDTVAINLFRSVCPSVYLRLSHVANHFGKQHSALVCPNSPARVSSALNPNRILPYWILFTGIFAQCFDMLLALFAGDNSILARRIESPAADKKGRPGWC